MFGIFIRLKFDGLKNGNYSATISHIPILLNGGDTFVSTALASDDLSNLIDGITKRLYLPRLILRQNTVQNRANRLSHKLFGHL